MIVSAYDLPGIGKMACRPWKNEGSLFEYGDRRAYQKFDPEDPYDAGYDRHIRQALRNVGSDIGRLVSEMAYCRLYSRKDRNDYLPAIVMVAEKGSPLANTLKKPLEERYGLQVEHARIPDTGYEYICVTPEYAWEDPDLWLRIRGELDTA